MIYKEYTCVVCGKKFQASQPAKYCSPQCKKYVMNHRRAKYECVVCGKLFEGSVNEKPKFCSQACVSKCRQEILANPDSPLSKYMTVKREKNVYTRTCTNCGKKFETLSASTVNRQCPECMKTYSKRWSERVKEIQNSPKITERALDVVLESAGIEVLPGEARPNVSEAQSPKAPTQTREEVNARRRLIYAKKKALGIEPSLGTTTKQRNALIEQRGAVCECCGYSKDPDGLQIHHKDVDRSHNDDDNLIILCACCHAIVHQRIRRNMKNYTDKTLGVVAELEQLMAEEKSRNEAGITETTRTEGCE